jgi:hypothetical protein
MLIRKPTDLHQISTRGEQEQDKLIKLTTRFINVVGFVLLILILTLILLYRRS